MSSGRINNPSSSTNCSSSSAECPLYPAGWRTGIPSPCRAPPPAASQVRVYPPVANPTHISFRCQHGKPRARIPCTSRTVTNPSSVLPGFSSPQLPSRDVLGGFIRPHHAPLRRGEGRVSHGRRVLPLSLKQLATPIGKGSGGLSHRKGPLLGKVSFPRACSQTHGDHSGSRGLGRG